MSNALEINSIIAPSDDLGNQITNKYQEWVSYRENWLDTVKEIREYVYATDTRNTTNASLPWKNKVHVPKLCQIRDNLHANYMAALFPNDYAIQWEGDDQDSEEKTKRLIIEQYMQNKMRQTKFRTEVSKLVFDFIDYGNVFAMPTFVADYKDDPDTNEKDAIYVGPKLQRISPLDIVFDPTAVDISASPKIIRTVKNIGSWLSEIETHPELKYIKEGIDKMKDARRIMSAYNQGDFAKNDAFQMDGFTSWWNYFTSSYVEVLDFYGDIYDLQTGELKRNHLISVVDRRYIVRDFTDPNWLGAPPIRHVGWRPRSDNLYAMGPLENLVGMQYRIDHLENAKSDAFDLIIHPVMKVKGFVEPFNYGPGEEIYIGDEGDVTFMAPDVTMLQADTQIQMYEAKMEEMAGAPKQAMGFRTPGEKTAYEVQILENGANRIFLNKTAHFEEILLEPLLNDMLELARRNFNEADSIRVLDSETGAVVFRNITKDDLTANGKIRPIGARHFAQNANIIQNLTQFYSSSVGQDPAVRVHISGKRIAEVVEQLLGFERFDLVQDNIRLMESAETQKVADAAKAMVQGQGASTGPVDANSPAPAVSPGIPDSASTQNQGRPAPNAIDQTVAGQSPNG